MSSQGPLLAGTGGNDASIGTSNWVNPGNITAADGVYATNGGGTNSITYYLTSGSHGFSIPTSGLGVNINGVLVEVLVKSANAIATDWSVRLLKAGALNGPERASLVTIGTTASWISYGGPTDLWDNLLAASDFNNSGFGAAYAIKVPGISDTVSVDAIRITVFYTPFFDVIFVLKKKRLWHVDKFVERVRNIVRILPIATPQPSFVMLPVNRVRRQIETRTQKLRPLIIGTPAPPAIVILVRRPRLFQTSFPQIRNRALVTSIQVNTIPFLKKPRLYEVRYPTKRVIGNLPWVSFVPIAVRANKAHPVYYPLKRQQKVQFATQVNQPLLVTAAKRRPYAVPYYVKRAVHGLFSSVTNVMTNVTTLIAPPRRARPYSQSYVVQRTKGVPIQPSSIVVGSARRLRAYPVAAIYKTKPHCMVTSVVVQSVPLPVRRTRSYQVPYQPKRVGAAFFTSITVSPTIVTPHRMRLASVVSVVKRRSPMAIYLQPLVVAPPKRVRAPSAVSAVKRLSPLPSSAGQSVIVPVRSNRLYQLANVSRRSVNRLFSQSQSLVVAPRKIRQATALYPQKRPAAFVSIASGASAVIVSKRTRTISVHSVRRIVRVLPGSSAAAAPVIAPRRVRSASTLYPIVRRTGGAPSLNVSQAVQVARARNVRFVTSYFPQKRSMTSALFGQPVLVTYPRKVR